MATNPTELDRRSRPAQYERTHQAPDADPAGPLPGPRQMGPIGSAACEETCPIEARWVRPCNPPCAGGAFPSCRPSSAVECPPGEAQPPKANPTGSTDGGWFSRSLSSGTERCAVKSLAGAPRRNDTRPTRINRDSCKPFTRNYLRMPCSFSCGKLRRRA